MLNLISVAFCPCGVPWSAVSLLCWCAWEDFSFSHRVKSWYGCNEQPTLGKNQQDCYWNTSSEHLNKNCYPRRSAIQHMGIHSAWHHGADRQYWHESAYVAPVGVRQQGGEVVEINKTESRTSWDCLKLSSVKLSVFIHDSNWLLSS